MASPFIPFDTQYSAHTDVTIHPATGVLSITVAFHPNNHGSYNLKLWELDPPYTGQPRFVREYVQGVASVGPFGHGASIALPTGGVLMCVPVASDSMEVKPSIAIDHTLGYPYPLHPVNSGGMTLLIPQHTSPLWEGRTLSGGELVNIPSVFNVPSAGVYSVRLVVQADRPDVRLRIGTQASPALTTICSQVANVQMQGGGLVPGPSCYVSIINGPALCWMQITGWQA